MAEAESWRKRVDEGAFGACFLNVFGTLEEIPLFSIGLSQERHDAYVRRLEHLGATPSPLTLNINKWTKICYADPRAEEVLRNVSEGMQVDFNTPPPTFRGRNFVPAADVSWILDDLREEVEAGRFAPCDPATITGFIPVGMVSRVADGETKKRKIHNYSFAESDQPSFNECCENSKKKYASVKQATQLLRPNSFLAKIDLHKAFRYVGASLELLPWMGCDLDDLIRSALDQGLPDDFAWCGEFRALQDTRMAMGMKPAPGVFHELTDIIARRLRAEGVSIVVYQDDFLIVGSSKEECARGFNLLLDLVRFLGFDVSPKKVVPPTQALTFLGVELNTNAFGSGDVTLGLSESKVSQIVTTCLSFETRSATIKEVQSLMGRMSFAAQVIDFASTRMQAGFAAIGCAQRKGLRMINPAGQFLADLHWWSEMLPEINGLHRLLTKRPVVRDFWATDACTSWGIGGFFDGRTFAYSWDTIAHWGDPLAPARGMPTWDINYMELYAVDIALKLWAPLLSGCRIVINTDNSAAYWWLLKLKSKKAHVTPLLQRIAQRLVQFDVLLGPKWLATDLNVLADCLSRGNFQDFPYLGRKFAAARRVWASQPHSYMLAQDFDDWKIDPALFSTWDAQFGPFHVDGCADAFGANSQLDSYWTDFEAHDCTGLNVYANLPFSNLETLLLHFLKAKRRCPLGTAGLFVLPFWPDKAFWTHIVLALPDVFKIIQRFKRFISWIWDIIKFVFIFNKIKSVWASC